MKHIPKPPLILKSLNAHTPSTTNFQTKYTFISHCLLIAYKQRVTVHVGEKLEGQSDRT